MGQLISFSIRINIDNIKTEYNKVSTLDKMDLAVDSEGNAIDAYYPVVRNIPRITLTHNGIWKSFKPFSDDWINFQRESQVLTPLMSVSFRDNNLEFSGDCYSKRQFEMSCEKIEKYLTDTFKIPFSLNSIDEI